MRLDVYDNQNGSMLLAWTAFAGASSYNVYLNGALNQNVTTLMATVSGLTIESYSQGGTAAPSGNSIRPQSMPPVGVVTQSATVALYATAVVGGVEKALTQTVTVTVAPESIMLTTPMKRVYPFPNLGLD